MKNLISLIVLVFSFGSLFAQAPFPFEDNFDTGNLNLSYWTPQPNLEGTDGVVDRASGIGLNNSSAVRIGKLQDGSFTTNALDLSIDLSGQTDVELTFWILDSYDGTDNTDGIYFSDDGGNTFVKVLGFFPDEWCNDFYGQYPPLDVDGLAATAGLSLTSQFVIRFQQRGENDFRGSTETSEDGFYIDDVRVYDPGLIYHDLSQGDFVDDFETGLFSESWAWNFADATSMVNTVSEPTSPMNIVSIQDGVGINGTKGVAMGRRCDGIFTVNALDLHLNLSNQTDVELTFWIADSYDATDDDDGIYFSDDGGNTFVKVLDFIPDEWCSTVYGQHPPLDVDGLATEAGLSLSAQFVIRFQQRGENDFRGSTETSEDGFYLDDIHVYDPGLVYHSLSQGDFLDDFETGLFNESWAWNFADATSTVNTNSAITSPMSLVAIQDNVGVDETKGVVIGRRCDGTFTVNALDLHLNLSNQTDVEMTFLIADSYDGTDDDDGIYFSDNGGVSFVKVFDFDFSTTPNLSFVDYQLSVSDLASANSLSLTNEFVVRFQQRGENDFGGSTETSEDGLYLDRVYVTGTTSNCNLSLSTDELSNSTCGDPNGQAVIAPSGGTPPYSYTLSGPTPDMVDSDNPAVFSNLLPGSYSVVVSDANGCTANQNFTVGNNCSADPCSNVSIVLTETTTPESCTGNDGSISLTASGGTAPYTYSWNTGASGASLSGVGQGSYSVTVTDANGCTANQNFTVGNNCSADPCSNVSITLTETTTPESCTGNDGSISLTASGGTAPYTYSWNTGAGEATLSGLGQGSYSVTVTDANGCSASQTYQVADNCNSNNCPTANFTAENLGGGTYRFTNTSTNNPLAVFWQFGDGGESITPSPTHTYSQPGTYTVTLIVANACGVPGEQEDTTQQTITVSLNNAPLIQLGEAEGPSGETVLVPVIALNFNTTLGAIQGILNVQDPAVGQIEGLEGGLIGNFPSLSFNPANGRFSFFDAGNNNLQLGALDTLFYLRILLQGNNGDMSAVTLSGELGFPLEFGDTNFNLSTPATEDGKVTILNNFTLEGLLRTHLGVPIPDATVQMEMTPPGESPQTRSHISGADGRYLFDQVPAQSACTITPEKNTNAANGLSAIALFVGQRFILGYNVPQIASPFHIMAGDANCDGVLTTLDLFIIQKVHVAIESDFSSCPSWVFVPASEEPNFQLASVYYPNFPYPRQADLPALNGDAQVDFIGVKVGDILDRADPNALQGQPEAEPRSMDATPLLVRATYLPERQQMRYELITSQRQTLASYQFSLGYDTQRLAFQEATAGVGFSNAPLIGQSAGRLNVSWFSISGEALELEEGDVVLTLYFDASSPDAPIGSALWLDERGLPARMHDDRLEGAVIELQPLQTTSLDPAVAGRKVRLYQNQPNPFRERTQIGFFLPEASTAQLIVRDALGRVVWEKGGRYLAGEHFEQVELALPAGMYFYTLRTETSSLTRSMLISE